MKRISYYVVEADGCDCIRHYCRKKRFVSRELAEEYGHAGFEEGLAIFLSKCGRKIIGDYKNNYTLTDRYVRKVIVVDEDNFPTICTLRIYNETLYLHDSLDNLGSLNQ